MKSIYFLSDAHLGSLAIPHARTQERRLANFLDSIKHKAEAVYLLGEYYYYGVLVEQDEEHAAELYRRAKALGSVHGALLADAELLGLDRPTTIMELAFQEAGCIPGPSKYLD